MTVGAKICGINDADAMQAAIDGGAAHVGLVFYAPSPRSLDPAAAAELAELVPDAITRVGLFVNPTDAEIDAVLAKASLDMLQLHGHETPARIAELRRHTGLEVMKVIKVAGPGDSAAAEAYLEVADWLMFDAKAPADLAGALPGGNALVFDWTLLGGEQWALPWMLAGGLDAANVAAAVRLSGASTVDTSSGVEDAPGRKNPSKIKMFLDAVAAL
jgi:phosphoribosylanthranilate isomerase